jgi:phosphoglycolate phosphatase
MNTTNHVMRNYSAIVFDLDGTLIDSQIDYQKMSDMIKEILTINELPELLEDRRKVYRVIQGGELTLLEFGLPKERVKDTLLEMEKVMNSIELEALSSIEVKPNAHKTLQTLKDLGFKLGIATRGHNEYAYQAMKKTGLYEYFIQVVARNDVTYPKPDPRHLLHVIELLKAKPEETLFIGDTTTDLRTAKAAHVDFIGYNRGESWVQRLLDEGCERIINDLYEVVDIVK